MVNLNFFKFYFSKNKIELPYISFNDASELDTLRSTYPDSIFIRDKDKIFYIDNNDLTTQSKESVEINRNLFSNIIAECFLRQFYRDKNKYSIKKEYHLFEVTLRDSDISNGKFKGIRLLKTFNLHFFPLLLGDEYASGFTISTSLKTEILLEKQDFLNNNIPFQGLYFYETGKVKKNNEAINRIANHFKYLHILKNEKDQYHSINNEWYEVNKFFEKYFNDSNRNHKLPDNLKINSISITSYNPSNPSSKVLHKPKNFYYNSRVPNFENSFNNRKKVSYNKPFTYDQFENREIKINIIYPKQCETDVRNFFNDVKKELGFTFKINESNIKAIGKKIEDFSLKSYQKILSEIKDVDLVFILVDQSHESLSPFESPYYFCKAEFLKRGISTQEFQLQHIQKYLSDKKVNQSNYTDHNIALNIYAKLGGVAWTVKPNEPKNELVIGIGATTDKLGNPILGLTSIFRGDGKYLLGKAFSVTGMDNYQENLEQITSDAMENFIKNGILETEKTIYLIFHIFKPAGKNNEIRTLQNILRKFSMFSFQYAFIHIGGKHNYRSFAFDTNGKLLPKNQRGTFIAVNSSLAFLNLKPKSSTPIKIEVHRESNFTDLDYIANQVYQFTEMSHTSYNLSGEPITIKYPQLMARFAEKFKEGNLLYSENKEVSIPDNSLWFI